MKKIGLCICLPVTSKVKGYPFETPVKTEHVSGVALCSHIRSLDFSSRKATHIGTVSKQEVHNILSLLGKLLS